MSSDLEINADNIDFIFSEIGGFGLFQIITYLLICIPNAISATYVVGYIFTANTLEYRCKVPECDTINNGAIDYHPPWLNYAIPNVNSTKRNCFRYGISTSAEIDSNRCDKDYFNQSTVVKCNEFVYHTDGITIQNEFGIACEDTYKLALVGTINNLGRLIFMPITGLLSDKFGRLTVLVIGMVGSSLLGIIKSFTGSYAAFILLEFLESSAGTCTFAAAYILGVEWVSSKNRVLGTTIISISYPIGEIFLGIAAMYIHNFRYLLRTLYTPGLFIALYFWLVPESVRWLLVTGRTERATKILKRVARINGKDLSQKSLEIIQMKRIKTAATEDEQKSLAQPLSSVMKSKKLMVRLMNCCYCWVICAYCYYGLSLSSTQIQADRNKYLSFITVVAAEIPGLLVAFFLLNRFGRRTLLSISLMVSGIATILSSLMALYSPNIVLILFIIGKCSITCAFSVLYIFTAEMWPTSLRNTMMNLCSMVGRSGAMLAPLTPLLAVYYTSLPFLLFGGTAILASLLVLLCPETLNKKLPETIEDAKNLR